LRKNPFITLTLLLSVMAALLLVLLLNVPKETPPVQEQISEEPAVPPISVREKKRRFKERVVPAVEHVYAELRARYEEVALVVAEDPESDELDALRQRFKAKTNDELLAALKPHPKSIAIAQAAIESSWGTSRFFKEANNAYGIWSFNKNEPRIAASDKRGTKTIWLKKYETLEDCVRDYYRILARGAAYKEFRTLRLTTNDPYLLVKKLTNYSEIREKYAKELAQIIRYNKFRRYDDRPVAPVTAATESGNAAPALEPPALISLPALTVGENSESAAAEQPLPITQELLDIFPAATPQTDFEVISRLEPTDTGQKGSPQTMTEADKEPQEGIVPSGPVTSAPDVKTLTSDVVKEKPQTEAGSSTPAHNTTEPEQDAHTDVIR